MHAGCEVIITYPGGGGDTDGASDNQPGQEIGPENEGS